MRYLSVCSGIEAASVAWGPLSWKPVGFSEIEKFPCAVLAHHYPTVQNLGDITKFTEWPDAEIDILVGGTPCQSFSIAGLRKGLNDPRGNIMLTYLGVIDRYKPRYVIWENVPGVLSSNKGRDFGSLLNGLGQLGYGFAYRVLDAQFCRTHDHPRAVPQRRRRVFVVGYLGSWRRAAAILFDSESLRGNPPPRRSEGKEIAGTLTRGFGDKGGDLDKIAGGGYALTYADVSLCLTNGTGQRYDYETETFALAGNKARVRRLTPLECERLQGFPDEYTNIPSASNTARYKALGNSMAVNCMRVIADRITMLENIINNKGLS